MFLKFLTLVAAKKPRLTAQTQIKLIRSSLFAFLTRICELQSYILFENRKRRVRNFRAFTVNINPKFLLESTLINFKKLYHFL